MTGRLHGVHHPDEVAADEALSWFVTQRAELGGEEEVIGYLLAPDRAEWFRCHGTLPHGPDAARDLTTTFEIFATTGMRHLRWWHTVSGKGRAVSLAEHPDLLPPGKGLPPRPERTRLDGAATRLLAGLVAEPGDGWVTLVSARFAPCQVPVTAERGQEVWAELAEYSVCDEHGNLSVADTLLLGLQARAPRISRSREPTERAG
ncbi:MAG: hypothetical protein JO242_11665 [Streptosporangiaceae bacterium]|nr:hypothetical protein [Streptosporangiaceae bacterium]